MNHKKKNDVKYNILCTRCRKKCKQVESARLLACPHFDPKEVQLEFKFKPTKSVE